MEILYYGVECELPRNIEIFWRSHYLESSGYDYKFDHITLGHRTNMTSETFIPVLLNEGKLVIFSIDAVGTYIKGGSQVIAFRVKNNEVSLYSGTRLIHMKGINKTFHITAFIQGNEVRPKDSNKIEEWYKIPEISIVGKLKIWRKG